MPKLTEVRQALADQFIDALNKGQMPWTACWKSSPPENAVSGRRYSGTNSILLSFIAAVKGWPDSRWATFKQAKDKGWHIKKGSKGTKIEYWSYYDVAQKKSITLAEGMRLCRNDPNYRDNLRLYAKTFVVFNAAQIDGIPERKMGNTNIDEIRAQRDTLIANMGVRYEEFGDQPYYSPSEDLVVLPPEQSFNDTYSYLCTFLHECGHASGHESRLNRDLSGTFGTESYAIEELRVEIASAFAAQEIGLQLTDQQLEHHTNLHMAYVQNWAQVIGNDPSVLIGAINDADKISTYLLENGEFVKTLNPSPVVSQRQADNEQERTAVEIEDEIMEVIDELEI